MPKYPTNGENLQETAVYEKIIWDQYWAAQEAKEEEENKISQWKGLFLAFKYKRSNYQFSKT